MSKKVITRAEANEKLLALTGLPVSLPWKGYGSAIFFELGDLSNFQSGCPAFAPK